MVSNLGAPIPTSVFTRPLVGPHSLAAEYASWRMHQHLRGRDFEDDAALQRFVQTRASAPADPLPADADPSDRATDLFYRSRLTENRIESRVLINEALSVDPEHVDALVDKAVATLDPDARLRTLERAVALSDKQGLLDEATDGEPLWPCLPARPALRARAALALELIYAARLDDAVDACAGLLALNPTDNQGVRYQLFGLLLELGRHDAARRLLAAYNEPDNAVFSWGGVLLELNTGGDALAALEHARFCNQEAEFAILQPEVIEVDLPDHAARGSEEEADFVGDLLWRAWHRRPDAVAWLREHTIEDQLHEPSSEPVWQRMLEAEDEQLPPSVLPFLHPGEPDVVRRLVRLVEEGPDEAFPELAEWAVTLLDRLGKASSAIPEIVAYLVRRSREESWTAPTAIGCLSRVGAAAMVPLLDVYAMESDLRVRQDLAEALAAMGVRDERIFEVCTEQLASNPAFGASLFVDYGDPRALPLLSDVLDRADPDPEAVRTSGVADLLDAIEELGGTLTAHQQERFREMIERRAYFDTAAGRAELQSIFLRHLDSETPVPGVGPTPVPERLARPDRPGRNEPCWCGSGVKYKRCHLAEDEGARE